MPKYMDIHHIDGGVAPSDLQVAHEKDLEVQGQYGVSYDAFWVDESAGTIFCLVDAPDAEAATRVHREAHGLVADEIHLVQPG